MKQARPDADQLIRDLERLRDRYRGSRLRRLAAHPLVTVASSVLGRLTNERANPVRREVRTFFGERMAISLPPYLEIFISGAYASHDPEVRLTEWLIRNLREGDTFYDCGAHYGYYTLLASQRVGSAGRVVAVEPSPLVLPFLRENVARCGNAALVEAGISDAEGEATFYESDVQYSVISTLNRENLDQIDHLGGIAREVSVRTTTLAAVAAEHGDPAVVKLDVEGAEAAAIRGGEELLRRAKPAVALEVFLRPTDNDRLAVSLLEQCGYRAHAITPGGGAEKIPNGDLDAHLAAQRARYAAEADDAIIDNLLFLAA